MREMYTNAGFDDYLTKPIDAERLETMLLQYLPDDKVTCVSGDDDIDEDEDQALPDFLYDIKEIDTDSGLNYCGDGESYVDALMMYMGSAEKKAEEIEKYRAAGDIKNVTIKVHALKSASRSIGALKLGEFAERLEKAGDSGDQETLYQELDKLLLRYRQLARDLEPLNDREEQD
ncbi:MAG: Hpt domain-containing protein, partial [Lachnospiraceae bacterium]|nr:Hpt domain-containing protein [Lachnospiraceae bacterium]